MNELRKLVSKIILEETEKKEAAVVLIINDVGDILTVSRKNDSTKIGLPGGKVDPGESPKQAAIRELYEECGLNATDLKQVFVFQDVGCYKTFCFIASVTGKIFTHEEGVIRWVKPSLLTDPKHSPFARYNSLLFKKLNINTTT